MIIENIGQQNKLQVFINYYGIYEVADCLECIKKKDSDTKWGKSGVKK